MEALKASNIKDVYGLTPQLNRNDKIAKRFIWIASVIVFVAVALLAKVKLNINPGFDPHVFARANAVINSAVTILLLAALISVKQRWYLLHKRLMVTAIILSFIYRRNQIWRHKPRRYIKY